MLDFSQFITCNVKNRRSSTMFRQLKYHKLKRTGTVVYLFSGIFDGVSEEIGNKRNRSIDLLYFHKVAQMGCYNSIKMTFCNILANVLKSGVEHLSFEYNGFSRYVI